MELYIIVCLVAAVSLSGIFALVRGCKIASKEHQDLEPFEAQKNKIPLDLYEHIEQLYSTFAKYPLKDNFEFEYEPRLFDLEAQLHRTPLRQMGWRDFGTYPGRALTSFGDIEDFKHFLPRIFELYVSDFQGTTYDMFFIFSRFEMADFETWGQEERESVFDFLCSWLNVLKADEASREDEFSAYTELLESIEKYKIFGYV